MELSVIMPCLNEANTVGLCVAKAIRGARRAGLRPGQFEVIVADNGSMDGSRELARAAGARVLKVRQRGYGAALRAGIFEARGRVVLMADSDDSYDFREADAFLKKLGEGYDLVVGNRFRGGIAPGAMPFLHRLGNPVLSGVGKLVSGAACDDFHCGLRAGIRERLLALDLECSGMEFASEMIVKAAAACLRIAEVPARLEKDGRGRPPHLKTFSDGWRHLRFLIIFFFRRAL